MAREFLNIGCVPCDEQCQQVGMDHFDSMKEMQECREFLRMLRRVMGPEPAKALLAIKGYNHDFGVYHEVICYYDPEDEESIEYAFKCEGETPMKWDNIAKANLGLS